MAKNSLLIHVTVCQLFVFGVRRVFPLCLLFLVPINKIFTQPSTDERFNQAFMHIYVHIASQDVNQALKSADSLFFTAGSNTQKIRSLMLISDMHHRLANRDSAIHYAKRAERVAQQSDNYLWQARIYGVLSTQHREMGLLTTGRQYVQKGLEVIEKIADRDAVNQFKGQCFQELGFYDGEEGSYDKALVNFRRAEPFFVDLKDSLVRAFALSQNHERIALCHLELGNLDSAKLHYRCALELERSASAASTPVKGFIYNGMGRVHLIEKQFDRADSCFQRALAIAEATELPNLKISVYKNLVSYYELTGNDDDRKRYTAKYLAAMEENTIRHKRYADHRLVRVQRQLLTLTASQKVLTITTSAILVIAGLGLGLYVRKQRANRKRYQTIIQALKPAEEPAPSDEPTNATTLASREKELMPERTKQDLLKKLAQFESSQQFTERNISVAVLAGKMKTNTKYLSYIINNYRNKDFNSYINELRIKYIIAKIDEDSRYLNYKISYLAEECGFATHSQFTTVFKSITGLSPSQFMLYRKKDKQ